MQPEANNLPSDRQEAIVQLIAGHQTRLRAFIRCLMVDGNDVDDVLQETNRVLWQKAGQFQLGTNFWAWSAQVARFEVLSQLKRRQRDTQVVDSDLVADLATIAEEHLQTADERRTSLEKCLQQQPPASRQLVEMRYTFNSSIDSISKQLGRPGGSIRQTLYRIRLALMQCVERRMTSGEVS